MFLANDEWVSTRTGLRYPSHAIYRHELVATMRMAINDLHTTTRHETIQCWLSEHLGAVIDVIDQQGVVQHTAFSLQAVSLTEFTWNPFIEIDAAGRQSGWGARLCIEASGNFPWNAADLALRYIGLNPYWNMSTVPTPCGVYLRAKTWKALAAKQLLFGPNVKLETID